jgi:hypothetical protein
VTALWRARLRLVICLGLGVLIAWIWHLGYQDPPWSPADLAYWLHFATEALIAFGIGGSLFILSGAALRYFRAQRSVREQPIDSAKRTG